MTEKLVRDRKRWVIGALNRYEQPLTRYARRLLGNEEAARDAVQHAFLKLCDQAPERVDERLASWLYTVCRNKALDHLRSNGRTESLEGSSSEQIPGREADPATSAERTDLSQCLLQLLEQIPAMQREVLELWLDGFSYREIAGITDRSEGSIRVSAHRALQRLKSSPLVQKLLYEEGTDITKPAPILERLRAST